MFRLSGCGRTKRTMGRRSRIMSLMEKEKALHRGPVERLDETHQARVGRKKRPWRLSNMVRMGKEVQ